MTDEREYMDKRWVALALLCMAQFVVDSRRLDRQRRAADDRRGPHVRPGQPFLGRQLLRPHLRWLPAPRRAPRRPPRPPAGLHRRPPPLRRRLARRRLRRVRGRPDRRARGSGLGRRAPLAGRALDRHHHVQGRIRAQQGARHLGRGRRIRRRCGRPPRRRPHRVRRLGVGPVGQRADRDRRRAPRPAPHPREPLGRGEPHLRHPRRGHGDRRPCAPRLRAGRGARRRLGLAARRSA